MERLGQPDIQDLDRAIVPNLDVRRLEIAMIELGVARAKDLAHSPGSDGRNHFVGTDACAWSQSCEHPLNLGPQELLSG